VICEGFFSYCFPLKKQYTLYIAENRGGVRELTVEFFQQTNAQQKCNPKVTKEKQIKMYSKITVAKNIKKFLAIKV
jgi:hypothetical protein